MKILGGFWGIGLLPSSLFLRSNSSFIPSSSWSSQSGKVIRDGYNFGKWIIGESIGKKHKEQHVQSGRQHYFHSGKYGMLGTTVLCVRKGPTVVIIADGQVTLGSQVVKPNVRKVRRIGDNVIGGFAGATADALTLFERLENRLEDHSGQLTRAAVELAKQWRTDKFLRRLDAVMVVADSDISLTITGNGDVLEPHDGVVGIGSGGPYAIAAARALIDLPGMDAETIALRAMKIAADNCIYTNHNFVMERISSLSDSSEDRLPSNGDSPDRCISKVKTSTSVVPTTSDVQGRKR